jgi:hypothetical protein
MTNIKSVKKLNDNGRFTNTYLLTLLDDKEICVPHAEDNTDYQAILKWVAEGNTIEEAD